MGLVSESSESVLEEALRNISIPKGIDLINLVNCNRQNVVNRFWDSYDAFTESKNPTKTFWLKRAGLPSELQTRQSTDKRHSVGDG